MYIEVPMYCVHNHPLSKVKHHLTLLFPKALLHIPSHPILSKNKNKAMKASLRLREDNNHQNQNQNQNPLLLRLKLPMSVLGFPFISSITAGDHPTDLSFNLRTNCFNGPSLKLSYSPNTTNPHLSLSLKSGVGLFGSPNNSPLIMSAQFNLFGTPNPNPTFFLQIKPQFGDFFLSKTAVSASLHNPPNFPLPKENGAVVDGPIRNLRGGSDGIFSGVAVTAKTIFPVTKRAEVKFRWGVNFTTDSEEKLKLPFLTIDKVSVERVEKEEVAEKVAKSDGNNVKDLELMKGMCCWMRREVEDLQRENNSIKERLNEVRLGKFTPIHSETSNFASKKAVIPLTENSSEFDRWRSKKNGADENGRQELHNFPSSGSENSTNDVEEELKRAIKAASS